MKKNGAVALRVAGIFEILIGITSIAMTFLVLSDNTVEHIILGLKVAKEALGTLIMIYAIAGFRIISGIVALVLAKNEKKYTTCLILGMLLLLISITGINYKDGSALTFTFNYAILLVPSIYIFGAIKNGKALSKENKE